MAAKGIMGYINPKKTKRSPKKKKTEEQKRHEEAIAAAAKMPSPNVVGESRDDEEAQQNSRKDCTNSTNLCGPIGGRGKCCDLNTAVDGKFCHFKKREQQGEGKSRVLDYTPLVQIKNFLKI